MLQQNVNTAGENVARIGQFLKAAPALAMTPEQMAQRIAAAGSAAHPGFLDEVEALVDRADSGTRGPKLPAA